MNYRDFGFELLVQVFCDLPSWLLRVPVVDAPSAQEDRYALVDCRSPIEKEVSVAVGAEAVEAVERNGAPVAVYCTVGFRSAWVARKLRNQGHDAHNLRGGILSWCRNQGQLQDSSGDSTDRVHVYHPALAPLVAGYRPVS